MYKRNIYKVVSNRALSAKSMLMVLEGDTQYLTAPGQFVNVEVKGKFLRRPISVCDYDEKTITLLYDIVGEDTKAMSLLEVGAELDLLTGLGNGFDAEIGCRKPLLLGGGVGIAPMYNLAKMFLQKGVVPVVIMGFNSKADVVMEEEFRALGAEVYVATVDGSHGTKGFVTNVIENEHIEGDYFYACGPMPMLKALSANVVCDGELSLDERMACGFGVCMCCSVQTKSGAKRICKEGPVFKKEDLIWK